MESYESVFDEEWVNLSSILFSDQDSDHFSCHGLFSSKHDQNVNLECPAFSAIGNESNSSNSSVIDDQILVYASDHDLQPHFCNYISGESSNATDSLPYQVSDLSKDLCMIEGDSSNFLFMGHVFSDDAVEEIVVDKGKMENSLDDASITDLGNELTPLKRKYEMLELSNAFEDEGNTRKINKNPKKKTRVSRDNKNKKNLLLKKIQKEGDDESHQKPEKITNNNTGRGNRQSSSSCSLEDESNVSHDFSGDGINLTIKTRATRGAATDPQSIYARKRRERINERLRILQNLVPNGTKVDISTMLEEAVHYVKFLQLQIKLLSSDDMWIYAPIAYNGMDTGLYQNISRAS